jgi:signal transduction histidine kinase/ActR/RegA family two-component response regulator
VLRLAPLISSSGSSAPRDASQREVQRLKKFSSLVYVIVGVCVASIAAQAIQGALVAAVETSVVLLAAILSLVGLRLRIPLTLVATGFVSVGAGMAGFMGLQEGGAGGMVSVFWMAAAPLMALIVAGRKAGYLTLLFTLILVALCLWGIESKLVVSPLLTEAKFGVRTASMLGAVITLFFIVRAYDVETEASIEQLQRQNRELEAARSVADSANRAKGEFLATISHEIRTPLNGVNGMVSLLETERDPDRIREGLQIMRRSSDTLLAVINDVLDFSKIDSNQLELEDVPFSVRNELKVVVDLIQGKATEKGSDVELTITSDVPQWVLGDMTRFRQVVLNLLANAVKFGAGGPVACSASVRDNRMLLAVSDQGIGMSAETLARLFTPFVQADASTTRRFGGSGLGLVIARRLVEAMSGTIEVESTLGKGSRFQISLPIRETVAPRKRISGPLGVALAPLRVLLVEDNVVNQLVARKLLERFGHHVTLASDGRKAVEACQSEEYDVILMDCHMPELDGFGATEALRGMGVMTPVYALTAAVSDADRDRCLASGMDDLIPKPLRLERLQALLRTLPKRQRPPRPAA